MIVLDSYLISALSESVFGPLPYLSLESVTAMSLSLLLTHARSARCRPPTNSCLNLFPSCQSQTESRICRVTYHVRYVRAMYGCSIRTRQHKARSLVCLNRLLQHDKQTQHGGVRGTRYHKYCKVKGFDILPRCESFKYLTLPYLVRTVRHQVPSHVPQTPNSYAVQIFSRHHR